MIPELVVAAIEIVVVQAVEVILVCVVERLIDIIELHGDAGMELIGILSVAYEEHIADERIE